MPVLGKGVIIDELGKRGVRSPNAHPSSARSSVLTMDPRGTAGSITLMAPVPPLTLPGNDTLLAPMPMLTFSMAAPRRIQFTSSPEDDACDAVFAADDLVQSVVHRCLVTEDLADPRMEFICSQLERNLTSGFTWLQTR